MTLVYSKGRGGLSKTHPAIEEICLLTKRAVWQAVELTKKSYLLVVNPALCHLFLNDCHLPFECTSHAAALINAMVKRCAPITFRFEATKADVTKLSRLNIIQ